MVYKETLEQLNELLAHYRHELNSLRDQYDRTEHYPPEQNRIAQEITKAAAKVDALESLRTKLTKTVLKKKEGQ